MALGGPTTVGAGSAGASRQRQWQTIGVLAGVLVLLIVVSWLTVVVFLVAGFGARVRRTRWSRMLAAAGVAFLAGWMATGWRVGTMFEWHLLGWWSTTASWLAGAAGSFMSLFGADPRVLEPVGWVHGVMLMLPVGLTAGLLLATGWRAWDMFNQLALNDLEGAQYDFDRPFGVLDEWRRRRSVKRIESGKAANRARRTVGLGTGRYGELVSIRTDTMISPTVVLGRNRTGKTALTQSVLGQAATGGVIVIDFKGDEGKKAIPTFWAQWAEANNRVFKHFKMAPTDSSPYVPPTPWAPALQACYDPIRHGNAESKSSMLQNSIVREGDAAVYFRTAHEFDVVAFQVAALTGFDRDKSGFDTLRQLCDVKRLVQLSESTNPATGKRYLDPHNPEHAKVLERVHRMDETVAKDQILRAALSNNQTTLSQFQTTPAVGPWLRPGDTPDNDIDLVDAVTQGHVVVFSLPTQSYPDLARTMGMLVINDLNNCVVSLRTLKSKGVEWDPCYVQIEEFGSAGAKNIINLINKCGDVHLRVVLSTQSWSSLVAVGDTGTDTDARTILNEAGNVFTFSLNDEVGATVMSELSPNVTRKLPREEKEWSGSLGGVLRRSANLGRTQTNPDVGRQLAPDMIQNLGKKKRGDEPIREFVWIACSNGQRVTHTYEPHANHWVEPIESVLAPPDATVKAGRSIPYPDRVGPQVVHGGLVSSQVLEAVEPTVTPATPAVPASSAPAANDPAAAGAVPTQPRPRPASPPAAVEPAPVAVGVPEDVPLPLYDDLEDDPYANTYIDPPTLTPPPHVAATPAAGGGKGPDATPASSAAPPPPPPTAVTRAVDSKFERAPRPSDHRDTPPPAAAAATAAEKPAAAVAQPTTPTPPAATETTKGQGKRDPDTAEPAAEGAVAAPAAATEPVPERPVQLQMSDKHAPKPDSPFAW